MNYDDYFIVRNMVRLKLTRYYDTMCYTFSVLLIDRKQKQKVNYGRHTGIKDFLGPKSYFMELRCL